MSLQVEGHRRGRSRSPGGRDRDRSRSRGVPVVVDVDPAYDNGRDRDRSYDYGDRHSSSYRTPASPDDDYYHRPRSPAVENGARSSYGDLRDYRRDSPRERHSDSDRERERERDNARTGLGLADAFLPQKYAKKLENSDTYNLMTAPLSDRSRERSRDRRAEKKEKLEEDLAYGKIPPPPPTSPPYDRDDHAHTHEQQRKHRDSYLADPRRSADLLSAGDGRSGGRGRSRSRSTGARDHSTDGRDNNSSSRKHHHAHRDSLTADPTGDAAPRKSAMKRNSSPQPPVAKMSSLSVNTAFNASSLSAAPPSPLLESYHGTYQSMSPMPSPLLLPTHHHGGGGGGGVPHIADVSPLNSDDEAGGKKRSRRARFADPEDDAQRLADALKGSKAPRTEPLVEILPGLTHDQIMDLRAEYKRLVKTGPEKKGVNIAKHIRVRLKDEDPSLMKACYATALGRWESEAYWSSFWYQGDKTRRELLIESLMGRTNEEIHEIRQAFSDKTYDNSLTRCMRHELKEDKFKKAVLLVLEEDRMDDLDKYGRPLPIDQYLVEDDADDLRSAVKAEKGGESAMINIVVKRSDSHLREVLRVYNDKYRSNFARDALRKSGNLVGELLAHILNGVINKPVRDALLVHHALTASKKDALRRELLTSRLVRYHWDGTHMTAVKRAYQERYGKDMMEAVEDGTSGEWGQFCRELCITRMPDKVAKFHVSR
ncbi:annexin [Cryphonectria parasitica EP155]|uniref:Annexin n=1 Tax=Cryphonectria parasitica (strain ATCC 38755 / EP155) TaxID=660469 RepID=A0A9P4Y8W5_CRYP1|nr:annexin [Cryphonectria parasitica EP155]KAF3768569.1 annexin [Cryphonectria parasitica EP155]